MSRPFERTFSFEDHGDYHSNAQHRLDQYFRPGQDSPYRDMQISPPQTYMSPPPREYNVSPPSPPPHRTYPPNNPSLPQRTDSSISRTPTPPNHPNGRRRSSRLQNSGYENANIGYSTSRRSASTATLGMDNMGLSAAGGGIAGIAYGIASTNDRDSGIEALRPMENSRHTQGIPLERGYDTVDSDTPYIPAPPVRGFGIQHHPSYSSTTALGAAAASPGQLTPQSHQSNYNYPMHDYSPQDGYLGGRNSYLGGGDIDPNNIEDDGDDGIMPLPRRRSVLGLGAQPGNDTPGNTSGVAAGGLLAGLGGLMGRKTAVGGGQRDTNSGQYGSVTGQGPNDGGVEKSEWLTRQTSGRRRLRWIVGAILAIFIIAAIVGGVVGGIEASKSNNNHSSGGSGQTAAEDDGQGDLTKDSTEIQKLLGNPNLHKVFPGMDYTPFNAQYPACLSNMPSQNNVTRDMAVLSQLTNAVRLYGTDCNQTEMVLHAINKLALTDMKIWLGVWLENNATTNTRQLNAMYEILDKNGDTPFAGVIVGNEVLFRKDMTEAQLGTVLSDVKSNFTSKNIKLPVATSDLGDNWTAGLAADVDIVMSNVHPFFAGVTAEVASGWTWNFWQTHDVVLTQGTSTKNIISEVGWPSAGGNDCGEGTCTSSTNGSVAGIDEMNTFMEDFVCQSLTNGTEYFWFEAFDEPWKVQFNTPTEQWEDKWGLMDSGRNLKPGLKIPDCGGQTAT